MATSVGNKAEHASDSAALEVLARVGLVAYGAVHLLVGWLAVQIAWGLARSDSADTSGAMKVLADQPFGRVLLWLVAVGLVALALWQTSEVIWGYRNLDGAKRVRTRLASSAKSIIFAALGYSAGAAALGGGSSSTQSQQQATSGVLGWPGGRVIVIVAGLVIIAVGVASIVKGVKNSFAEEIDTSPLSPTLRIVIARLGQVGYVAKGLAFGVVGGLLSYATVTFDPHKAQGLDGAMQTILAQPFGRFLLTAVALGFAAFGLFTVLQSRYRRM